MVTMLMLKMLKMLVSGGNVQHFDHAVGNYVAFVDDGDDIDDDDDDDGIDDGGDDWRNGISNGVAHFGRRGLSLL